MFQLHFIELTMLRSASLTCLYACCCHGLRLPVFNKETTYLLKLHCTYDVYACVIVDTVTTISYITTFSQWPAVCNVWNEDRCGERAQEAV